VLSPQVEASRRGGTPRLYNLRLDHDLCFVPKSNLGTRGKTYEEGPVGTRKNSLCPPGLVLITSDTYIRVEGFSNACFRSELCGASVGRSRRIIRVNVNSISFEAR